jgi:hypothetical protein
VAWAGSPVIRELQRRIVDPAKSELARELSASNWLALHGTLRGALEVLQAAKVEDPRQVQALASEMEALEGMAQSHPEWTQLSELLGELFAYKPVVVEEAQGLLEKLSLSPNQVFHQPKAVHEVIKRARQLEKFAPVCRELVADWKRQPQLKAGWPPAFVKWVELAARLEPKDWICWSAAAEVLAGLPSSAFEAGQVARSERSKVYDQIARHAYPELLSSGWRGITPVESAESDALTLRLWRQGMERRADLAHGEQIVHQYDRDITVGKLDVVLGTEPLQPEMERLEVGERADRAHSLMRDFVGEKDWVHPAEAIATQTSANVIYTVAAGATTGISDFLEGHAGPKVVERRVTLTPQHEGPRLISIDVETTVDVVLRRQSEGQPLLPVDRATYTMSLVRSGPEFELINFDRKLGAA